MPSLIYFDNAATTRVKPECVYDAYNYYLRDVGVSPGRSSYGLGIEASRMLYETRKTVASFFGALDMDRVFFTKSSTEAINLFANGYLEPNDHILLSCYEHNAVLRPIHNLSLTKDIKYSVLGDRELHSHNFSCIDKHITSRTKVAFITLASNLTGEIVYTSKLGEYLQSKGIRVFVDASQGAGKLMIDMTKDNIDFLAFTGHKDLHGLPGTGGLCCNTSFECTPLIQGGTGIHGDSYINPNIYPESYEAGTMNMPALWALKAAIDYISQTNDFNTLLEKELIETLIEGLACMPNIILYNSKRTRVSTFCFCVKGVSTDEVIRALNSDNICVRGGIHCAILAHETLGTVKTGAVRVSVDYNNTKNEVSVFLNKIMRLR